METRHENTSSNEERAGYRRHGDEGRGISRRATGAYMGSRRAARILTRYADGSTRSSLAIGIVAMISTSVFGGHLRAVGSRRQTRRLLLR